MMRERIMQAREKKHNLMVRRCEGYRSSKYMLLRSVRVQFVRYCEVSVRACIFNM